MSNSNVWVTERVVRVVKKCVIIQTSYCVKTPQQITMLQDPLQMQRKTTLLLHCLFLVISELLRCWHQDNLVMSVACMLPYVTLVAFVEDDFVRKRIFQSFRPLSLSLQNSIFIFVHNLTSDLWKISHKYNDTLQRRL